VTLRKDIGIVVWDWCFNLSCVLRLCRKHPSPRAIARCPVGGSSHSGPSKIRPSAYRCTRRSIRCRSNCHCRSNSAGHIPRWMSRLAASPQPRTSGRSAILAMSANVYGSQVVSNLVRFWTTTGCVKYWTGLVRSHVAGVGGTEPAESLPCIEL